MNKIEIAPAAEDRKSTDSLKSAVKGVYDLQNLRVSMGNRMVAQFKIKMGYVPGTKEENSLDEEATEVLETLRTNYKKITDGIKKELPSKKSFKATGIIHDYAELVIVHQYIQMESQEESLFRRIKALLEDHPLWTTFLSNVQGCGPASAAVIISSIDITKAEYPSSLWKYCGYDVVAVQSKTNPNEIINEGRRKRIAHMLDRSLSDKDGNVIKTWKALPYNPWLKSKLWLLGGLFLRCGNAEYTTIYRNRRMRQEQNPRWKTESKKHLHDDATRYMIKRFLVDLYKAWRPLEGLPVAPEYSEAKLGLIHGTAQKYAA